MSHLEAGRRGNSPPIDTIAKLSAVLRVDRNWLGFGVDPYGGWQCIFDEFAAELGRRAQRNTPAEDFPPKSRPRHLSQVGGRKRPTK
jgi:hypothetical protein